MADLFENPMGTDGFEFVEYSHTEPEKLEKLFQSLGFKKTGTHKSKKVTLWQQGDINFILNAEPEAIEFAKKRHGGGAIAMAFRVKDAAKALAHAVSKGAKEIKGKVGPGELSIPAIEGIGGSILYLVDKYGDKGSIYETDFNITDKAPAGAGLTYLDHLTHNVMRGNMAKWADFYTDLFNFREIRYFDISGEYTGLTSKAMTAPDGMIRIPLNEESGKGGGQIEEFLMQFNGEGIQHIALLTDDIRATLDELKMSGVPFVPAPPETYYEMLEERLPGHGEEVSSLKTRGILMDGTTKGEKRLLLQIFSQPVFGPVFFEFIQRKGDEGFGEGNFKALFESMERDQIRRGVLQTA